MSLSFSLCLTCLSSILFTGAPAFDIFMRSHSVGSGVLLSLVLSENPPTALKQLLGNATAVTQIKLVISFFILPSFWPQQFHSCIMPFFCILLKHEIIARWREVVSQRGRDTGQRLTVDVEPFFSVVMRLRSRHCAMWWWWCWPEDEETCCSRCTGLGL